MQLAKQVAVVTGAASGMGLACAELFTTLGLSCALIDNAKKPLQETAERLGALALPCDVSDESSVENAFATLHEHLGPVSICVNCAGIAPAKRMVGKSGVMPLADFKQVIDINLVGSFNVMRLAAASMLEQPTNADGERGVIINTASVAAYEGQIGQTAYSASKGGLVALTLPAARELASSGIRVNTIAPGLVATPLLLAMPEEVQQSLAKTVPFPKRLAKPEEFAQLAKHIIENVMINGEVIRLDGALRMAAK